MFHVAEWGRNVTYPIAYGRGLLAIVKRWPRMALLAPIEHRKYPKLDIVMTPMLARLEDERQLRELSLTCSEEL